MRICAINLPTSKDRRERIVAQLTRLDLEFELIDAVDGEQGRACFASIDERRYFRNTGRSPESREIGCYASHLLVWRKAVELDEPVLVLEDDATLLPNFRESLVVARGLIERCGFIRLQNDGPAGRQNPKTFLLDVRGVQLSRYRGYPYGAMAYVLSPEVARTFLESSRVLAGPVDLFIKQFWVHGRPLFCLTPHSVQAGTASEASTIGGRQKLPPGLRRRSLRAISKLGGSVRRARFNFANRRLDVESSLDE
jgi:glycosyl transferase family 25